MRFLMALATYIIWILIALYCYYAGLFERTLIPVFWLFAIITTSNLGIFILLRTGLNRRFKDPSLTLIQIILATIYTLIMAYSLDKGRGIMLLLYMVVFTFGTFRLNFRQFFFLSLFAFLGYGSVIVLLLINDPESVNLSLELFYLITLFVVLVWFSFIGSYINGLRKKLSRTNNELNNANALIRLSEERFRDLAELLPETVFEADPSGRITFVNRGALEQFGYTEDDLRAGLSIFDAIVPGEHDALKRNVESIFSGEKIGLTEYLARRKDGTYFPTMAHTTRIVRDGKVAGLRGFLIDITEKKSLEEQLLRAQKMEAVGNLAGGIAHDFNNLLMGILGNTSLILMETDSSDPSYGRLKKIEEYITKASDLTKQLLGFARGGKYDVRPTGLGEFIRESAEMFGRTKKEIRTHLQISESLWNVEVDRNQMGQVFLNLFLNAWQAMPDGGEIIISAENVNLSALDVAPHELNPGRYVRVTVKDSGVGMDEATKSRIFEPFFTTRDRLRGTGLGLASVYGIIKHHGGFITVESTIGTGSSFMIHLPASDKDPEMKLQVKEVRTGTGLILLIDDEEMILDVGSQMLSLLGYEVLTAQGGKAGIETYLQSMEKIDLVILDIIMPDISGKETFERLRNINNGVNVLLSSGYSMDEQTKEIMEKGCKGFIQKPFTMGELSARINGILKEKQGRVSAAPAS